MCTRLTPKLIKVCHDIKAKDDAFEVIFITVNNCDDDTFEELLFSLLWLALPVDNPRKERLMYRLKVKHFSGIIIAIGPSGRTVARNTRELIQNYGANAYPFTEEHLQHLEGQMNEMAKGWPKKLKHELHPEHEIVLRQESIYDCNACSETRIGWRFCCELCAFCLHPRCFEL
ncbi:Thioredoxin-like fold containing protein [Trema orientale]|uniref:protein-disulfide reductase n=1 Tax=Trema orientale TaxID=63057 RepID=A0A2P5C181_TREOI|nr:Thioredoxin-like fold containing protein [Trema orientale]